MYIISTLVQVTFNHNLKCPKEPQKPRMVTSVTLLMFAPSIKWAAVYIYKVYPTRPNAGRYGTPPVEPHTKGHTSEPPYCLRDSHWFQWHTSP